MKLAVPPDNGVSSLQARVVEAKISMIRAFIPSGIDTDILTATSGRWKDFERATRAYRGLTVLRSCWQGRRDI